MAERHSIDLPPRSQDLFSVFFDYYHHSGGIWYIKTNKGELRDCSDDFLTLIGVDSLNSALSKDIDCVMHDLFGEISSAIKNHEKNMSYVYRSAKLFVVITMLDQLTPLIVRFNYLGDYVLVTLEPLNFLGMEQEIINHIHGVSLYKADPGAEFSDFYGVNPFISLSEQDWVVAWLMCVGMSKSDMATYLDVSDTVIKRRMRKIYRSLKIRNYDNFMYASVNFYWQRFIPPSILKENYISTICSL